MGLLPTYVPQHVDLRQLYFNAPPPPAGLSAPHQTLGQRLNDYITGKLGSAGVGKRLAKKIGALPDYSPVSAVTTAFDLGSDLRQGQYGSAVANGIATGLNAIPDVGPVAKGMFAGKAGASLLHSIIAPLWHGSPHKFEKFALEKIGTGEGAQAYGHGLYFAEQPEVARQYQRVLGYKHTGTAPSVNWDDPASAAGYWVNWHGGDVAKARDELERMYAGNLKAQPKGDHSVTKAALEILRSGDGYRAPPNPGHLYEVKLEANPEDFLNWDAPLSKQPQYMRDALEPLIQQRFGPPTSPYRLGSLNHDPDGQKVFRELKLSGGNGVEDALRSAGVPGLRYFDQGSRDVGNGTRNYVVFNPDIIDILNRH